MNLGQSHWCYVLAIVCLLLGALNYVLFRNDVIFLAWLGVNDLGVIALPESSLSRFILFQASDLLWALSIMFYASAQPARFIRVMALALPIGMELLQIIEKVPGEFDCMDLAIYILISSIFYVKWKLKKEL